MCVHCIWVFIWPDELAWFFHSHFILCCSFFPYRVAATLSCVDCEFLLHFSYTYMFSVCHSPFVFFRSSLTHVCHGLVCWLRVWAQLLYCHFSGELKSLILFSHCVFAYTCEYKIFVRAIGCKMIKYKYIDICEKRMYEEKKRQRWWEQQQQQQRYAI